jgi:hypothetical protein
MSQSAFNTKHASAASLRSASGRGFVQNAQSMEALLCVPPGPTKSASYDTAAFGAASAGFDRTPRILDPSMDDDLSANSG